MWVYLCVFFHTCDSSMIFSLPVIVSSTQRKNTIFHPLRSAENYLFKPDDIWKRNLTRTDIYAYFINETLSKRIISTIIVTIIVIVVCSIFDTRIVMKVETHCATAISVFGHKCPDWNSYRAYNAILYYFFVTPTGNVLFSMPIESHEKKWLIHLRPTGKGNATVQIIFVSWNKRKKIGKKKKICYRTWCKKWQKT